MNVREFITGIVVGLEEGGPGSGHWGHRGIPGRRGGSAPGRFTVKGVASDRTEEFLKNIYANPDPEQEISYMKALIRGAREGSEIANSVREAISRYRYWEAIAKKQIEVTPSDVPGMPVEDIRPSRLFSKANRAKVRLDMGSLGADSVARGELKDKVCRDLAAESGLSYVAVNERIKSWATTSNDTNKVSLAMQVAAHEEFGSKLSPWQQNQWAAVGGEDFRDQLGIDDHKVLLRTMYASTQNHLRSLGVPADGFIRLYRGAKLPSGTARGKTLYDGNALESWSTDAEIAGRFGAGKNTIYADIPVARIVSTATTGFGCLTEKEVVVLGGMGPLEAVVM